MDSVEFCDLVACVPVIDLCELLGIDPRTLRRYKSGQTPVPVAAARLVRLRFAGDASALLGPDWAGFRYGKDGKLYIEGWRGGFDPHQIRAMFFGVQLVRHHEATIRQLERRIDGLEKDVFDTTEACLKYRRLVMKEARFGLMLERIVG